MRDARCEMRDVVSHQIHFRDSHVSILNPSETGLGRNLAIDIREDGLCFESSPKDDLDIDDDGASASRVSNLLIKAINEKRTELNLSTETRDHSRMRVLGRSASASPTHRS
jgi:hypothetical protein